MHEVLGIGGMATVYKAWDRQLAVFRAVKVLSPLLANRPAIRARFLTEARAMARLRHPYVVSIQDVIDADGQIFIVMDLIGGGTAWQQVVRNGPPAEREAVRLLTGIAGAVQAAHDAGIVHRDIKPQNILLTESGEGRLTDFGIARFDDVSDRRAETRTGTVMGTWGFMPPEQRNDASRVGPRSDVYAMGATLWALVRGRTPTDLFMADREPEMLHGFSPALAKVIVRATRYRPDDRYASAGEFASALEAVSRNLRVETRFPEPDEAAPRDETSGTLMAFLDPVAGQVPTDGGAIQAHQTARTPRATDVLDAAPPFTARTRVIFGVIGLVFAAMGLFFVTSETPESPHSSAASPVEAAPQINLRPATSVEVLIPSPQGKPASHDVDRSSVGPATLRTPPAPANPASISTAAPRPRPVAPTAPSETAAGSAAPPPDGRLEVTGPAIEVWMQNADGDQFSPGGLPPGSYRVFARFSVEGHRIPSPPVQIESGQTLTLECSDEFKKCIPKR